MALKSSHLNPPALCSAAHPVRQDRLGYHRQDEGHLCGAGPQAGEEEAQEPRDPGLQEGRAGRGSRPRGGGRSGSCPGKMRPSHCQAFLTPRGLARAQGVGGLPLGIRTCAPLRFLLATVCLSWREGVSTWMVVSPLGKVNPCLPVSQGLSFLPVSVFYFLSLFNFDFSVCVS